MSMAADFGLEDTDGPDRDYWYEEEDVLIAQVAHTCCGRTQSYYNCGETDVPSPETICRDCRPVAVESECDPFDEEAPNG